MLVAACVLLFGSVAHAQTVPTYSKDIRPFLAKHGLSYTFDSKVLDGKSLAVTCTVRHRAGHSQSSVFVAEIGGGASPLPLTGGQKMGGTTTLAMRYALIQALAITTAEDDTDDRDEEAVGPPIDAEKAANIDAILDECPADRRAGTKVRMLAYLGVGSVESIPLSRYAELMKSLVAKRKGGWAS